ncbi:9848_t:CDS:2 [Funneliformis mosseae]|uniref:9848_t:CDS:1 n=1 Tax=Funneliformis mosseae TaxID=27381 RepID=A0A9N9AFT3_FUNMO|nr:9848_t:CDS:2 [Funneliformis mosseae]
MNISTAKAHHYLANIAISSVSQDEKKEHSDEHYCLAFVKEAKQFVALFLTYSIIIFQDYKAKIPLGILTVRRTFQII